MIDLRERQRVKNTYTCKCGDQTDRHNTTNKKDNSINKPKSVASGKPLTIHIGTSGDVQKVCRSNSL